MEDATGSRIRGHVHIGPGSIGLGLVGELMADAKVETAFLYRLGSDRAEQYEALRNTRRYLLKLGREPFREVTGHCFLGYRPDDWEVPENEEAIKRLATARCVTTSVRESGLPAAAWLLVQGLRARLEKFGPDAEPVDLLAFENVTGNSENLRAEALTQVRASESTLRQFIQDRVVAYPVLVDRVCAPPTLERGAQLVHCEAESCREVVIRQPVKRKAALPSEILEAISHLDGVHFVPHNEYPLYEKRKFWLLNGIHLALATYTVLNGHYLTSHAIKDLQVQDRVVGLQRDFAIALSHEAQKAGVAGFELITLNSYNAKVLERFSDQEDDPVRILRDARIAAEADVQRRLFHGKLVRENRNLISQSGAADERYERAFERLLNAEVPKLLGYFKLRPFFEKVNSRVCAPIDVLLSLGDQEHAMNSLRFLVDLLKVLRDLDDKWS